MLVDLSDVTIRIEPNEYPGEVVFRTLTINLLDEPPLVLTSKTKDENEDGDEFLVTLEATTIRPFNGDAKGTAPLTAQIVDYRLPHTIEEYLVTSWSYECDSKYVAYVLCVVFQDDKFWVGINNEGDMGITEDDGLVYRRTKYEAYEAPFAFEDACLHIPLT